MPERWVVRGVASLLLLVVSLVASPLSAQQQVASAEDLRRLSIEELAQIKVTSVSKTEEPLSLAAASIFVITGDAIRRSGANNIAEILRLAPNLQVARLDANTYAITARGFNQPGGTANKLLVLIDGRVVYSPLFSGTFWDAQKMFIDDIDRIEVISGPGGTVWGANAVNGVINIITKDSLRTRGWDVHALGGTHDSRAEARRGGSLGSNGSFRGYALGGRLGSMRRANGDSTGDDWNHIQGGFRGDWGQGDDAFAVEGDAYRGTGIGQPATMTSGEISGGNLNAWWQRELAGGSNLRVQAYVDRQRRLLVSGIDARVDQYALESQFEPAHHGRHAVVIGAAYRGTTDEFKPGPHTVLLKPSGRNLGFASVFAQDSIALSERLRVAIGLKAEHNTYTGMEWMPDARLSWSASKNAALWTSVSRAVRTPSRFDTDLINPGILNGNPDFRSEELIAYQAGYRGLLSQTLSVSVSAYYNRYDKLRTVEASGAAVFPLIIRNNMRGRTKGVELWGDLSVRPWWRLSAGFEALHEDLEFVPGSRDILGLAFVANDPHTQWMLRSGLDLPRAIAVDVALRRVGRLEHPAVDAYVEADARIAWRASSQLELSLDGWNLLHDQHVEFVNPSVTPSEVPRSITLSARWTH
jgi:iron complex outermembrane recepter protein